MVRYSRSTSAISSVALLLVVPPMTLLLLATYVVHVLAFFVSSMANVLFGPLLNLALHGRPRGPFGHLEPVSGGLYRAKIGGYLTRSKTATWFYQALEYFDPGHCRRNVVW